MLRHLHIAVLIVAFIAFTHAVQLPPGFLRPRQNTAVTSGGSGSDASVAASTTTAAPTTTPQPTTTAPSTTTTAASTTPSTTATQSEVPTSQSPSPTTQPPTSTTAPTTAPTTQSTQISISEVSTTIGLSSTISDAPTTTSIAGPDSSVTVTSTNLLPIPEVLTTITFTSDGRLVSTTATSTLSSTPTSSSTSTSTSKPGLASGYGNQSNTLSAGSKKLIGGIVGGIGGALLLAGIAFVVYKMWGRKKGERVPTEEEYFAGSTDSIAAQKERPGSGWGPSSLTSRFAEPLDRYQSPGGVGRSKSRGGGGSVNAASNF
ncbi:hypothetical protein CAC42_7387 [Sphaceloma murrayae]|uniref:Mid2 domain-containing protein n=1 Tax=Sphaceloma murrayae TaxID=2082308 RepID=A0A2K1QXB2_9PEZI|nr:hypothetical protein CAC42_7387 [Sphaceloma murrayae]